jgi:hypothetical protein
MTDFRTYKRGRILDALLERLRGIRTELGFETDAGQYVTLGRLSSTTGDPVPRLALIPGETRTLVGNARFVIRELPCSIEGLMRADRTDPIAPVEAMFGDVKRALFAPADRTLEGLLVGDSDNLQYGEERHLDTEPGSASVAGSVEVIVKYSERFGSPEE